jgi:integrase
MGITSVEDVDPVTYLTPVGSTYYFRRPVPKHLLGYFFTNRGTVRTEWMESLRTKDRATAKPLCNRRAVETDTLIREAEAKLKASALPAAAWTQEQRDDYERAELEHRLASAEWDEHDLADLEADPERQRLHEAVGEARERWEQEQRDKAQEVTAQRAVAPKPRPKTRLGVLVDQYAAERKPSPKRVDAMVAVASWFEKHVRRTAVEDITPDDVLAFKHKLLAITSEANAQTKLRNFNTLLRYAKDQRRIIRENPGDGITVSVKVVPGQKRREYDLDALGRVFGSPVYAADFRPDAGGDEAAYWLPLLAIYTGARLEEIGQLRAIDIMQEAYIDGDGHDQSAWVIRITADLKDGLRLKNENSERRVPIHAELIERGFLDYVKGAADWKNDIGQPRIFPALRADKYGTDTANWSKWYGRYLRQVCGVTDKRVVFHSFRHSFRHYARQGGMQTEVSYEITGHEKGDVGASYGGLSYPLAPLVEAMKRYRVPGFKPPAPPPAYR